MPTNTAVNLARPYVWDSGLEGRREIAFQLIRHLLTLPSEVSTFHQRDALSHALWKYTEAKIAHMATRTATTGTSEAWGEDRRHRAVAELWAVIATYPLQRRPHKVAGNLALNTLHRLTARRPSAGTEIPTDPLKLPTVAIADADRVPG